MLNYAAAFVAPFGAIAGLGLNDIVVRDLVREPEAANTMLGTAFVLQFMAGLIAYILVIGANGRWRASGAGRYQPARSLVGAHFRGQNPQEQLRRSLTWNSDRSDARKLVGTATVCRGP